jgi:hypothetical protein
VRSLSGLEWVCMDLSRGLRVGLRMGFREFGFRYACMYYVLIEYDPRRYFGAIDRNISKPTTGLLQHPVLAQLLHLIHKTGARALQTDSRYRSWTSE